MIFEGSISIGPIKKGVVHKLRSYTRLEEIIISFVPQRPEFL